MGGDAAKQRKAAQLANEIAAAEAALDAARREYERVRQRNMQVGGWLGAWWAGSARQPVRALLCTLRLAAPATSWWR